MGTQGGSGSISSGKSNTDSAYASVTQQSGIQTGDGGFDITVQGKTQLVGGVISTTDTGVKSGNNKLTSTGGISTQDIHNSASYSAESSQVTIGTSVGSSSAGFGNESGNAATSTSNTARGSSVSAGGTTTIRATGDGPNSNLTIQGSSVESGDTTNLSADNKVLLLAAANTSTQTSDQKSSSGSVSVTLGKNTGVTVSAAQGSGDGNGQDVYYTNTRVQGGKVVNIQSGGDTTLKGAVVKADVVNATVGSNLSIESLQDSSRYKESSQNASASVTVGAGAGGNISAGATNINSNYLSVTEQSGIRAGDGGFNVKVQGNTDLKAGAITSTQKAVEDNKNTFTTAMLTTSDLHNSASYSAESYQLSVGTSGGSAGAGQDSGQASSTTLAAISGIAGNKAARTGDAETGIKKIFDQAAVTKDINAQVQITNEFGKQAPKAVADYAQAKAEALTKAGDTEEAKKWMEGGIYRVALHTTLGALTGGASGAAGAATIASAAPLMDDLQDKLATNLEKAGLSKETAAGISKTIAQTTALAVGTAVGGTQGGSMALNVDANNRQLHPTEALLIKQNAAKFAKQLNGGKEPAQAQIDAAQERLTSTTLNRVDSAFDKRITMEDAQAQSFLQGLASQYSNIDVGGGKLFDARGTAAFNNHTTNAQYLGQTAPLYNQLDSKDLKGVAPNVRGAYVAYSDASNDTNLNKLTQGQVLAIAAQGNALKNQATSTQEVLSVMSANQGRAQTTMGSGGIVKPGDGSKLEGDGMQGLMDSALTAPGDGSPAGGSLGPRTKVKNKLPSTNSEFVPVQIVKPSPSVEYATVNGQQIKPQNYQQLYHGTDNATLGFPSSMKPEDVAQKLYSEGLPARGSNIDLADQAANNPNDRAFRGTTTQPLSPNKDAGAVHWAGEGGLVIQLKDVPGYDVNAALEGRIKSITGYKGNPNMGEQEIAVPGAIAPGNIDRIWVVNTNQRTGKPELVLVIPKGTTK